MNKERGKNGRKLRKRLAVCTAMLLLMMSVANLASMSAAAAGNGVEVSVSTDKTEYKTGDDVLISVKVTNNTSNALTNMKGDVTLPEGLTLKGAALTLDSNLAAGQTTSGSLSAQISSGSQTPTQPPEQQKPNTQLPEQQKPNTQPPKQEAPKAEAPADSPKTGDSSRIGWTVVMILAAAGLLIYAGRKGSWKKGSALMLSLICVGSVFLSAGINAKAASTSAVGIAKISVDGKEEIIQVTVSWGVEPQDVHLQIEVQVDESTTAPVTLDLRKDGSYEAGLFVNGVLLTVQGEYTMSANGDLTFTSPENNAVATVLLADPPYEGGKGTVPCTATQQADGSYSILLGNEECKLHVAIIPGFLELDWPFNYEFVLSADEAARLPVTE